MRNGLNIAAMSELVAELKHDDVEAHLFYKACSPLHSKTNTGIKILTLEAGSTRAARDFSIAMKDKHHKDLPDYLDFALGALGCCALVTFVFGCSTKGISFDSVNAKVCIDTQQGKPRLKYCVYVECDGATNDVISISDMVSRFSPNHRVFQDENFMTFTLTGSDGSEDLIIDANTLELPDYQALSIDPTEANLVWLHGTQYTMNLKTPEDQPYSFTVDQPKQYIGYDYGPNPQEILLSSLLQEVKENMPSSQSGDIQVNGHVNLKGISGVDPEVEPKMDRLNILISSKHLHLADLKANTLKAIANSRLIPVIINPNQIQVEIYRDNQIINQYLSPQSQV